MKKIEDAELAAEKKYKRRDKKKKPTMKVSGRRVLNLKKIIRGK
jgi:hypothetical protein